MFRSLRAQNPGGKAKIPQVWGQRPQGQTEFVFLFAWGDLPAPIPETQELRDEHKKYIRDIAKVCQKVYQSSLASFDLELLSRLVPRSCSTNANCHGDAYRDTHPGAHNEAKVRAR